MVCLTSPGGSLVFTLFNNYTIYDYKTEAPIKIHSIGVLAVSIKVCCSFRST